MKSYLKPLVAAVALGVAGGANAAIDPGNSTAGTGELVLSVWDPVAKVSVTRDLGVTFGDFMASANRGSLLSSSGDSVFTNTFSGSNMADLRWNVAAFNNNYGNLTDYGYGMITTSNDAQTSLLAGADATSLGSAMAKGTGYMNTVNGGSTDYAANLSLNFAEADGSAYAGNASYWAANFGGVMGFGNDAGIDESLNMWHVATYIGSTPSTAPYAAQLLSGLKLDSGGNLSAVPVPAAVWLMGSALVGLAGISRRKDSVADSEVTA